MEPGGTRWWSRDPTGFAAAVAALLADPTRRAALAAEARRLVEERFDWSALGGRFAAMLEELSGIRTRARRSRRPPARAWRRP